MKKLKAAKNNFEYNDLPRTRKGEFLDIIKLHWKSLLVINLLLFIAFLPVILASFFKDNYGLLLAIEVNEGRISIEERITLLKYANLFEGLIIWALLYLTAVIVSGLLRLIRLYVFYEPIFLKEDFIKGIKDNYHFGAIVATFIGASVFISKLALLSSDNPIINSIPLAVFIAIILPPLLITYVQGSIYQGSFKSLFKNGILIFIKDAPIVLLFVLLLIIPYLLNIFDGFLIVKYIIIGLYILLFSAFIFLGLYLMCVHLFDKYINPYFSPEMYKKGLYDPMKVVTKRKTNNYPPLTFVWVNENHRNQRVDFKLDLNDQLSGFIRLFAADTYQVFFDDKFVSYGPNRTMQGYSKERIIHFENIKKIEIKVLSFGIENYEVDYQDPFFGCQVFDSDKNLIYRTKDFIPYNDQAREWNNEKYSFQRGFMEIYDFNKKGSDELLTHQVIPPTLLNDYVDHADYKTYVLNKISEGKFEGFAFINKCWWQNIADNEFNKGVKNLLSDIFFNKLENKLEYNYELNRITTGFIDVTINSSTDQEIFICFDEILVDNKLAFRRLTTNDLIILKIKKGENHYLSQEPYAFKYLKIISENQINSKINLISLENNDCDYLSFEGSKEVINVITAAKNTYKQNALDLLFDCPGRERGGYLCDSYFTAQSELFFSNKSEIEKDFLTNYLLSVTKELDPKMVPMCFPSEHKDSRYIPNWAMFLLIELADYYRRTNDKELVIALKEKIYNIISFLDKYINEFGLLENLESWVFVEWSICNTKEYISGVNYPSNMTYSFALSEIGRLYDDPNLIARSEKMKTQIIKEAYKDGFFIENSIRKDNILVPCLDHISETCQYYAIFSNIIPDNEFVKKMVNEFGPSRKDSYPNISRSNVFIGFYLRFIILNRYKENDKLIEETISYFNSMAEKTGTLWEKDSPTVSCCHGFASSVALFITKALTGYICVKDNKIVFDKDHKYNGKYKLTIKINK